MQSIPGRGRRRNAEHSNAVSRFQKDNTGSDLNDPANVLVPHDHARGCWVARGSFQDVQVGAAETAAFHLNEYIIGLLNFGDRSLLKF